MFRFYRTKNCRKCSNIQKLLKKLDYDHQVVLIDEQDGIDDLPEDIIFPVLIDADNILQGSNAILKRIEELETFRIREQFQEDSCQCNK